MKLSLVRGRVCVDILFIKLLKNNMKILNFIIGLAIIIVLSGLFTLGIKAFYPIPESPNQIIITSPPYCPILEDKEKCAEVIKKWEEQYNTTETKYRSLVSEYNQKVEEYKQKIKTHNRNIFIIGNIIGILFFIIGFLLTKLSIKTALAVGIGIITSGLYAIIAGYSVGWNSADDKLKFFVALVLFIILLGGSLLIGRKWKSKILVEEDIQTPPQGHN